MPANICARMTASLGGSVSQPREGAHPPERLRPMRGRPQGTLNRWDSHA